MDYTSGTGFAKLQWDQTRKPGFVIGLFQKDKGGMAPVTSDEKLYVCLEEIRQSLKTGSAIQTRSYLTLSDGGITIGGSKYTFITIQRMKTTENTFSIKGLQPELYTEKNIYGEEQYCIGYMNKTVTIVLYSKEEREQMLSYLSDNRTNSFLLFVSGYDPMDEVIEFLNKNEDKTENETWKDQWIGYVKKTPVAYDSKEYWGNEFVDNFVSRLQPKKVTYMSGHDNVGTSNHRNIDNFLGSMYESFTAYYTHGVTCYLNPSCVVLAKNPNVSGFNQRRNNGKARGIDYVNMLKTECVKGSDGLVHDTVDIVCHSMGFAHALGIIDDIKEAIKTDLKGLKLGRFYIIAPENACSGEVNVNEWQQVWQYGSDEETLKDKPWLQDGVAPQCRVNGLLDNPQKSGRAYIPTDGSVPQGFLNSHSIKNYGWIFSKNTNPLSPGYVKPRK
jgi:hypothetical protein